MPIHDGSKYMEKGVSIDALIFLLLDEWKGDKIIMIGDYNEESKKYTQEFLSAYGLSYDGEDNLYFLWSEGYLPKNAYEKVLWTKKMNDISDPFFIISKILDKEKDKDNSDYFMTSTKKVRLEKIKTDDIYIFVNYTKKEYVKFDEDFFQGFYTTNHDDLRKRIYMTLPILNPIVKNIVEGLIAHRNKHSDVERGWSGRFAGDSLGFTKESEFSMISEYTNIYEELVRMDYDFETHGQKLEEINGKRGWIMYEDHIHYDKDFIESDVEEESA